MKKYLIRIQNKEIDLYKFIKASNRLYNSAYYENIKYFKKRAKQIKIERDITCNPAKIEYSYYTSTVISSTEKIFILSKKQRLTICEYLYNVVDDDSEYPSKFKTYLSNRLNDLGHKYTNHHYHNFSWGEEWEIVLSIIEAIISGFWVLSKVNDAILFKREPYKSTAINSIDSVLKLVKHKHDINLNNTLTNLKNEIHDAPFISDKKIYKSIYIELIIHLMNHSSKYGLSRTYGAKEVAQEIMLHIFNKTVEYSIPKNLSIDKPRTLNYGEFSLYDT